MITFDDPAQADLLGISRNSIIHIHNHPLTLERIALLKDSVEFFGASGCFQCAECRALKYEYVRFCRKCNFTLCTACFDRLFDEQCTAMREIASEDERVPGSRSAGGQRFAVTKNSSKNGQLPPIMTATIHGDYNVVKELVDKNEFSNDLDLENVVDCGEHKGCTALILAAQFGYREIVGLLLARGASKEVIDNRGMTPLMHAAFNGHVEVVDELLFVGVTIDRVAFCGYTAILFAANRGHTLCCQRLFAAGASPAARTPIGRTALIIAAFNGHEETVRLLLKNPGVDANASDAEGYTALHAAIATKNKSIEHILSQLCHR